MSFEISRPSIADTSITTGRVVNAGAAAGAANTAAAAETDGRGSVAAVDSVKLTGRTGENGQVAFFAPTTAPKETAGAAEIIGAATQGVDIGQEAARGVATSIVASFRAV